MFVLSLAIIVTYIKPTLEDVGAIQEDVYEYNEIVEKASELNRQLNSLVQMEASFRGSDIQALETFLPASVDSLQVMADISNIADLNNITLVTLTDAGSSAEDDENAGLVFVDGEAVESNNQTTTTDFELEVTGEYEDFKEFLANLSNNRYLLEISSLEFSGAAAGDASGATTDDEGSYSLVLTTHAYNYTGPNRAGTGDEFNGDFN